MLEKKNKNNKPLTYELQKDENIFKEHNIAYCVISSTAWALYNLHFVIPKSMPDFENEKKRNMQGERRT